MRSFAARLISWQKNTRSARSAVAEHARSVSHLAVGNHAAADAGGTVIPYYRRFVAAFPDVRALAAAPLERGSAAVERAGLLPARAYAASCRAMRRRRARAAYFPPTARTLATLPGIGRSTAAAIAAFACGERGAILDGNVKRVLARHQGVEGFPGDAPVERIAVAARRGAACRRATSKRIRRH